MDKIWQFFKKYLFVELLALAVVFRLAVAPLAINGDLWTQSEWGKWMYENGSKGLYEWNKWLNEWPNHPPLISLVYWWTFKLHSLLMYVFSSLGNFIALNRLAPTKFLWFFDFIKWFGSATYENGLYLKGIIMTIKLQMILADAAIGVILYQLSKKSQTDWKKYVLAFLFLPFSWYLSALWGQSDQLAFVFLISAFLLIFSKISWLSPILFAISVNSKPTGLILVPIYLWSWYRQKTSFRNLIVGGILAVGLTFYITSLFTDKLPWDFWLGDLWKRLFLTKPAFTTVSAFNFWYIFHAKDLAPELNKYLGLEAKIWGYMLAVFAMGIAATLVKYKKIDSVLAAMFVSGYGAWLFMTNMYERYLFAGLVSLLFVSIYRPKYFKYFVILSFIYLANMYNGWWFPQKWIWLKELFLWNDRLVTRIFSLTNMILYLLVVWQLVKDRFNQKQ